MNRQPICKEFRFVSFFAIVSVLVLNSCVTQKKLEYIQQKDNKTEFSNSSFTNYLLKPNDELYIQISSLDDAAANVFSSSSNLGYGGLTPYGASLLSHTIDKEGFLELPVVGRMMVKDKSIAQVTSMIKESLVNVLNQPIVSVKLVNRYVSVLGEVRNPGHYSYSQDKLSILDAVSMAGDITEYGNRKYVTIIRNQEDKNIRKELNLTNSDILTSEFYYLQPNDIVYIKPLRSKFWSLRPFPFTVIFSTVTTTLLILSYYDQK